MKQKETMNKETKSLVHTNEIVNEDCLIQMKNLENNCFDYSLTSPPYNVSNNYLSKYNEFNDSLSSDDYFENQKQVISEMLRTTKKHVFYNIQMVSGNKLALHKLIGFFAEQIKEVLIWVKRGQPAISEKVFNSEFEYLIILSSESPEKRFFDDAKFKRGTQSNVFKIKNKHSNPFAEIHKAIMPLDIPRYFMKNFGEKNDIWFDPYVGTGTTMIAAIMEKKQWFGCEISKEYFDLASKRINAETNQLDIFDGGA